MILLLNALFVLKSESSFVIAQEDAMCNSFMKIEELKDEYQCVTKLDRSVCVKSTTWTFRDDFESTTWKVRDFRVLWTIGFLTSSARWLEIIIFSVLTWQWFGDATYAGLLFALRMIAISLTGIIFSLVSNHFSGQKIMFWAQYFVYGH